MEKAIKIYVYDHYMYKYNPLFFVHIEELEQEAFLETKAKMLTFLDSQYGDTEQETLDWALEYQILTRMLLKEGSLLLNPRYILMEEIQDELFRILADGPSGNRVSDEYRKTLLIPHDLLIERWLGSNDKGYFSCEVTF